MTVHVVADDPALLRSHLPVRDRVVETSQSPTAPAPGHDDVVVCRPLSDHDVAETVTPLASEASVVFVYTDTEHATAALDAGAATTVPDPVESGSSDHLAAAVARLRERTSELVSPIATALDDHPDIFFAFDPGGQLLEWNDTLGEVTGYDDELIAEMDPVDFFGPEATPRVETAIGQAVVDGETRVTAPLRTADGGEIPFEFTALLVDRGDSQAIVGSGRRIDGESDIERPARPPEERADLETQVTINRLFGSVVDAVLDAETRESTERAVCEALTGSDLFRFAWIGEYETDADRVEPRAWAGEGADYLDDRPDSTARTESQTTALEVVTADEPRIVSDIGADRSASIWRAAALDHGHRSAVAVPISRGDTTYGSLSVYAGETDAFDDIDDGVFDRLGSLLGYAIRTTEQGFFVDGSRTDDGSLFTGGQTNEVSLTVNPSESATFRYVIPAEWTVLTEYSDDVTRVESGDGVTYVYFGDVDADTETTVSYLVEAPDGTATSNAYTFGPAEVDAGFGWVSVDGTADTNLVAGTKT